jgi:hypothetical protein
MAIVESGRQSGEERGKRTARVLCAIRTRYYVGTGRENLVKNTMIPPPHASPCSRRPGGRARFDIAAGPDTMFSVLWRWFAVRQKT